MSNAHTRADKDSGTTILDGMARRVSVHAWAALAVYWRATLPADEALMTTDDIPAASEFNRRGGGRADRDRAAR